MGWTEIATKKLTFASVLMNPVYKDRNELFSLVPKKGLVHRIEEKNEVIMELAPILMNSAVNCVFLYGTPGTGKTAMITELTEELTKEAKKRKIDLTKAYVNCSENRTETTILIDILNQIGDREYPRLGWTRTKALSEFKKIIKETEMNLLIILDEADYALKESGDDILYRLSRINQKIKSNVSTLLISNDIRVSDYIKPRTASTAGRVKILFAPYNHEELRDILSARVKYAFQPKVVKKIVIDKIAEIEANRGGDARKALELLDTCGKLALAQKKNQITLELVNEADTALEKDTILNTISTLAKHQKLLFLTILQQKEKDLEGTSIYHKYKETCSKQNITNLSVRRIRTFLVEFDELGLLKQEVTWLRTLKKKSRSIKVEIDSGIKKKAIKMIRDSL
ncbi:AAA family ATPase [Candidatus Woesearchaeota archaeon]|jgi:archaeal cell division control protein 6|nr:AAA family ATPase [Candidatus Woesearchaeota archaeon]